MVLTMENQQTAVTLFDEKHATMQREYIRLKESEGYTLFGTEVPYGYGKGFIDVVMFKQDNKLQAATWVIAELKPRIHNFGEMIRQVRKAQQLFFISNKDLLNPNYENNMKFPLVIWADNENLQQCVRFMRLLTGIELDFFQTDRKRFIEISNKFEIETAIETVKTAL